MARSIDVYIDFISPYSYLAVQRLPALAARHGCTIDYWIADLKTLKTLAGNTGPATREIPIKLRYARADMQRWARHYGVTLVPPKAYEPLRWNKGLFFAQQRGQGEAYVRDAFAAVWGNGADMTDPAILGGVAAGLGWDTRAFLDWTESDEAGQRYDAATREAHARGVFGVPMIVIGDEMWWGNDRLDFVEAHLQAIDARSGAGR